MLTPFFLVNAVFFPVILLIRLTNCAIALITQSACVIIGRVMLLCMKSTVSDSCLSQVVVMYMLCVR